MFQKVWDDSLGPKFWKKKKTKTAAKEQKFGGR